MFAAAGASPECFTMQEDSFGNAKCPIAIDPTKLEVGWQEHFGYLKAMGYAVCIGEFGGNMDWPKKSEARTQNRYNYITDTTLDRQWQNVFVDYLVKKGIYNTFYWSINPESGDTYGIFATPYDPISNTSAWGTWSGTDTRKLDLLARLWNAPITGTVARHIAVRKATCFRVSSSGRITYSLSKAEFVSLKLFGCDGRLLSEVIRRQKQEEGSYSVNPRLTAAAGPSLAVFKAGDNIQTQMVYVTK
jgi:hypothetical protein